MSHDLAVHFGWTGRQGYRVVLASNDWAHPTCVQGDCWKPSPELAVEHFQRGGCAHEEAR